MNRLEMVLRAYQAGAITMLWVIAEIERLVTKDNIDAVMEKLPPEVFDELQRQTLARMSDEPGLTIKSCGVSPEEQGAIKARLRESLPILRGWFNKSQERGPGTTSPVPATPPPVTH